MKCVVRNAVWNDASTPSHSYVICGEELEIMVALLLIHDEWIWQVCRFHTEKAVLKGKRGWFVLVYLWNVYTSLQMLASMRLDAHGRRLF